MFSLIDELLNGPLKDELAPFIASGNDGAVVEILNRKDITAYGVLQTKDIQRYLFLSGLLMDLETKSTDARKLACRALELFPFFTLSSAPDLAAFTGIADALIADTELGFTETHKTELLALAEVKVSRSEQLGVVITIQDVAQATRGN
jgi:hypothetical protein